MFYESMGALLSQASEALASDDPGRQLDERAKRERRQITALLRRVGAIWPKLFATLDRESNILEATLRSAAETARSQRLSPPGEGASPGSSDPLARYRRLLCELDELVILLHEQGQEQWAQDALRSLRRGLADAAEAQGELVDDMLAA